MNKINNATIELKKAVLNNDTFTICDLIRETNHLLKYVYREENKTILLLACSEDDVTAETVKTLLDLNANLRDVTENNGWKAIHWAASKTNYEILNVLLAKSPNIINELDNCENNALHILINHGNPQSTFFEKCFKFLIEKGIDVNYENRQGISWALIKKWNRNVVKKIENQGSEDVNTEIVKYIREGQILMGYLIAGEEEQFINFNNNAIENFVNYTQGGRTLLQMSCDMGLNRAAILLLKKGADYGLSFPETPVNDKPIIIAAETCNIEIFEALLNKYTAILQIPWGVLPTIVQNIFFFEKLGLECYTMFMNKLKRANADEISYILNRGDSIGRTALHYAVEYTLHDVTEELLSLGASLGAKPSSNSSSDEMPINFIETETLQKHLDQCVMFDLKERQNKREDFQVKFSYRTLIPPYLRYNEVNFNEDLEATNVPRTFVETLVDETEVIYFMSQHSELKKLLKHPTITSFLYMKWLRVQWYFWINLITYLIFMISLQVFIFNYYVNLSSNSSLIHNIFIKILHVILAFGWLGITFREILELYVFPKKYFRNIENYAEIFLIIVTAVIVLDIPFPNNERKLFSSLAILVVAFELVLIIGSHPKFSTNVAMFRTVSYNFYKYLIWYSLPVIAFAISFHLLFATTTFNDNDMFGLATNSSNDSNTYDQSFNNIVPSVFKSIIMLTGEFDSGNISFDTFPVTGKLIFIAFIFTIAMTLVNLLNGLAVNDTQMIQKDAELIGLIVRTQFIRDTERILMNNRYIQNLFSTCLFPKYFNYEIRFYPRQNGLIDATWSEKNIFPEVCLENLTVTKTNKIIQRKMKEETENQGKGNFKNIESDQKLIRNKIDEMMKLMNNMKDSMDFIVEKNTLGTP